MDGERHDVPFVGGFVYFGLVRRFDPWCVERVSMAFVTQRVGDCD